MKRPGFSSSLGRKKASFPYILRAGRMFMFPASVLVTYGAFLCVTAACMGYLYLKDVCSLVTRFDSKVEAQYHRNYM